MEIDPIDGGPKERVMIPLMAYGNNASSQPSGGGVVPMQVSEEEEARQAIDMLRGEDVSARVAAANRLEAIAAVLGEQRTREVSLSLDGTFAFFSGIFLHYLRYIDADRHKLCFSSNLVDLMDSFSC